VSVPSPPSNVLLREFPVIVLASEFPVPLIAEVPVNVRFSTLAASVKVTEDSTHQLIPQAVAKGVRPALTPLRGALIQHCIPAPAKNGYTLVYTLNNNTDSIVYNWNNSGQYLFDFYQSGVVTHQTYKGNLPCKISTALNPNPMDIKQISLYPIPVINQLNIVIEEPLLLILTDLNGKELLKINAAVNPNYQLDMQEYPSGYYLLKMVNEKAQQFNKKICKF